MAGSYPNWKTLSPGDKATIIPRPILTPELQFTPPLKAGELEVIVNYKLWHFSKLFQRKYRFTALYAGGQQTWAREPRSD